MVNGLWAVPWTSRGSPRRLAFDAATQTARGDATIEFIARPPAGCPIFDLAADPHRRLARRRRRCRLPTSPRTTSAAAPRPSCGSWTRSLAAGPRTRCGSPTRSGRRRPPRPAPISRAMTWSAGPRLASTSASPISAPGRYLEAWVPANLIFDQFDLMLELQDRSTRRSPTRRSPTAPSPRSAPTTGRSRFPPASPRSRRSSNCVPTDTLSSQTGTVMLPGSGAHDHDRGLEARRQRGRSCRRRSPTIAGCLAANEPSTGRLPPRQPLRRVSSTSAAWSTRAARRIDVGALRHETFHSWWGARHQAGQPGGRMVGRGLDRLQRQRRDRRRCRSTSRPAGRAVPAESLGPGHRRSASYSSGERFFEGRGVADGRREPASRTWRRSTLSAARAAGDHDRARGVPRRAAPASRRWWTASTGSSTASPIRRRRPTSGSRTIRATPAADLWAGPFWNSPDLWIRNADDGGTSHQPPEFGPGQLVPRAHAQPQRSATARHFLVTFNVKTLAGIEFVFPADFLPGVAAAAGLRSRPGETRIVKARWPRAAGPAARHPCLLARRGADPVRSSGAGGTSGSTTTWRRRTSRSSICARTPGSSCRSCR